MILLYISNLIYYTKNFNYSILTIHFSITQKLLSALIFRKTLIQNGIYNGNNIRQFRDILCNIKSLFDNITLPKIRSCLFQVDSVFFKCFPLKL